MELDFNWRLVGSGCEMEARRSNGLPWRRTAPSRAPLTRCFSLQDGRSSRTQVCGVCLHHRPTRGWQEDSHRGGDGRANLCHNMGPPTSSTTGKAAGCDECPNRRINSETVKPLICARGASQRPLRRGFGGAGVVRKECLYPPINFRIWVSKPCKTAKFFNPLNVFPMSPVFVTTPFLEQKALKTANSEKCVFRVLRQKCCPGLQIRSFSAENLLQPAEAHPQSQPVSDAAARRGAPW